MRRETQNVVLALLGGALLKISFTGIYLRYVKPSLFPWLVATGTVMVVLAAIAIMRDILHAQRNAEVSCVDGAHRPPRSPWLLLLPVLAVFLAPPALGSDAVNRAGEQAAAPPKRTSGLFPPLPRGDAIEMSISEVVTRTVWDDSGSLHGRTLKLTGFLVRRDDGRHLLARMAIRCCAADAAPRKVLLAGHDPELESHAPDTWLEVTGTVVPGSTSPGTDTTPTFTVESIRPVPAPDHPYE
ncbi:TIGR03943 family protein [Longimycelium tulufanense]|uniref:TIGR03943 family protein n=1 Tax=Longimycelium tulufanense TaxID=907463 RepID=A0A8J3CLF7_9PSEU|nr:TIGR03943 family protein [Longimycelium tulufanense]GGM82943.1 TIGR03943 family protein [Longimycelium tulufanense]